MSVKPHIQHRSSTDATDEYDCGHCGGARTPYASVAGSFCSTECLRSHKQSKRARELLELLENDHRFCYTCFAHLKDVQQPPSRWGLSESVTGIQHLRPPARSGERTINRDSELAKDEARTGTICRCGNTDHRHRESTIQRIGGMDVAEQLIEAIDILRDEGKHEVGVDDRRLREVAERELPLADPLRFALTEAVILE